MSTYQKSGNRCSFPKKAMLFSVDSPLWINFAALLYLFASMGCGAASERPYGSVLASNSLQPVLDTDSVYNPNSDKLDPNRRHQDYLNNHLAVLDHEHLRFTSVAKRFSERDTELGLRFGEKLFGGHVQAVIKLSFQNSTSLILIKTPRDSTSRIFSDASGLLDVREGEEFLAQCDYEVAAATTNAKDLRLSLAGMSVDTTKGNTQIYEINRRSASFVVNPGDTLNKLEQECIAHFDPRLEEQLHDDLRQVLLAKAQIESHTDPAVEAIHNLLRGRPYRLDDKQQSWFLLPANVTDQRGYLQVTGEFWQVRMMYTQHYSYNITLDPNDKMRMINISLSPKLPEVGSERVEQIAEFVAWHAGRWQQAQTQHQPFTIDPTMLHTSRS